MRGFLAFTLIHKTEKIKAILFQAIAVTLLMWACYIPEVQLDFENAFVKAGVLSEDSSRSGTTTKLNGNTICTGVYMLGCRSELKHSWELREVLENKTPVQVIFAKDVGNSIGAIFLKRTFVIEVTLNGNPLPNCSQVEMLRNLRHPHWINYLFSIFMFLITLPLVFNFRFYQKLWSSFRIKN